MDGDITAADVVRKGKKYFEEGKGAVFFPCCEDGIIAIDGCTVKSGKVNVLVLEDNFIH